MNDLSEVRLIRLPLRIWQGTQEHVDGLVREFALIVQDADAKAAVPGRLLALVEDMTARYGSFSEEQRRDMEEALAAGRTEIDLTYQVPPAARTAALQLGEMLDEADEYCRRGEHLLTLASPPEERAFRTWFLTEFVTQLDGAPPTSWPDYASRA